MPYCGKTVRRERDGQTAARQRRARGKESGRLTESRFTWKSEGKQFTGRYEEWISGRF